MRGVVFTFFFLEMADIPESALVSTFEMLTGRLTRMEGLVESLVEGQARAAALAEAAALRAELAAQRGVMVKTRSGARGHFERPVVLELDGGRRSAACQTVQVLWARSPGDGVAVTFPPTAAAFVSTQFGSVGALYDALSGACSAATGRRVLDGLAARERAAPSRHGLVGVDLYVHSGSESVGLLLCSTTLSGRALKFWDEWLAIAAEVLGPELEPGCYAMVTLDPLEAHEHVLDHDYPILNLLKTLNL